MCICAWLCSHRQQVNGQWWEYSILLPEGVLSTRHKILNGPNHCMRHKKLLVRGSWWWEGGCNPNPCWWWQTPVCARVGVKGWWLPCNMQNVQTDCNNSINYNRYIGSDVALEHPLGNPLVMLGSDMCDRLYQTVKDYSIHAHCAWESNCFVSSNITVDKAVALLKRRRASSWNHIGTIGDSDIFYHHHFVSTTNNVP